SEARLFTPLALTKTFAMLGSLGLALLILPAAALLVLRRRPEPVSSGGLLASLLRLEHLRDYLLLAGGLALALWVHVGAGVLVIAMALFRLARPMLSETVAAAGVIGENLAAVIAVGLALTIDWLPLGPEAGLLGNVSFVATLLTLVLLGLRGFMWLYPALLELCLRRKGAFLLLPTAVVLAGLTVWLGFDRVWGEPDPEEGDSIAARFSAAAPGLGREYMPPFDEGAFLYMPTTMPHASLGQTLEMLQEMDAAIAAIPEVDRVVGKLGRVDSALDPAPVSMIESVITYVPEYRTEPDGTRVRQWRDHIHSPRDIWAEITAAAQMPGVTSAPVLMPINARIVMLQSGMRAPMGVKVSGPDLESIDRFGQDLERVLRTVPEVRSETVFADRVVGKPYLEIELDRKALGRYGLHVVDVQEVLQVALGGMPLSRAIEGRERTPIRVRYMREARDSVEALERVFVSTPGGAQVPLGQLAELRYARGPQVIKSEDTFLTSYVLFDRAPDASELDAVEQAEALVAAHLADGRLVQPEGVRYTFAGTYEDLLRSERRLKLLIPIALCMVFILLYLQFRR
ncbi:MAG: efflux RND transporter permease subunit, partial [Myxococcales bacterium]|nr:efflux RND transporter permease subunit [Myxococcales bacterium]